MYAQVTQGDVLVERDTYIQSRQGLDEMYNEARRQLKEECQLRQVSMVLPHETASKQGAVVYVRLHTCGLIFRMWRMNWLLRCQ